MSQRDADRLDLRTLLPLAGDGVHWTLERDGDLNVNLVHLDAGHEVQTHVNEAVDVPKGAPRLIRAGGLGLTYLTVHQRRAGPTIGPRRT